jgi:hypothetical protein
VIVEIGLQKGRKIGQNLIHQVIPRDHVPSVLTPGFVAKATAKWIVVGGAAAGGGTLAGIAASSFGGPIAGVVVGGFARSRVQKLAEAAALVIDP